MDTKSVLKEFLEKTVKGDFKNVHRHIENHEIQLDERTAMKFLIACCNACNNNLSSPYRLNEGDLVGLVRCLVGFIKTPLRDNCECYLQSVFYIIKLLLEKRSFDCILQLEELLMPEFMPLVFTEKQASLHLSICISMYNAIVKVVHAEGKKFKNSILKMCYLLSSLYTKSQNVMKLTDRVHNCIICLATLKTDAWEMLKFYYNFLDLVTYIKNEQFYVSLVNNLSFMYTHLLKCEKFELAEACLNKTVDKMKKLFNGKEYVYFFDILEMAIWINPINENYFIAVPEKAHDSLKNYYRNFKSTSNLQATCDFISSVAYIVLLYYRNKNNSKWLEKSMELHSQYYKFLYDVSNIMAQTPYQCHCKACPTKTNLNEALRTLNSIIGLGRLSITNKTDITRTYKMSILKYFDKYVEYITTLKTNGCVKWRGYWNDAGVDLYGIGYNLFKNKDLEMSILFMKKFVRVMLELEGLTPEIIEKTYLVGALSTISDAYKESKDYEKCLLTTAINIIMNGAPKDEIVRWIRAKAACRESSILEGDVQELTLLSVCRRFEEEVAYYDPRKRFKVDKQKQIDLLVYELKNYKCKWKSKVPMMSVFRELVQIADAALLGIVFIDTWGDCDLQVHETIPKLLQNTIKKLEGDSGSCGDAQEKFSLAYLYFLQHKYRVKDTIIKHCDEMERTMMNMTKTTNQNEPIPPDPNEECDIVSSYDCLKLTKYLHMMKELNKSLELIWEFFPDLEKLNEREKLFKLLVKIGHEYSLHCHITRSLQAWELALKVAQFDTNKLHMIQAVSFIIEFSDITKPSTKKLVLEAENFAKVFMQEKINSEELLLFYLCKSEAYFYVDFDIAYGAFLQVLKLHQDCVGNSIMQARVHLLHHKFVMLPCRYDVEGHRDYSVVKVHHAHNCAIKHYTDNKSNSAYEMRVFFQINENLIKMYHDMRLPREVRCYCKEIVVIAQKMVLPFRTTSYLYYLAHADINSCHLDDCRVKMEGFSDILCLTKCKSVVKSQSKPKTERFDKIVDNLVNEFNEMMLDVPSKVLKPSSTGSPSFEVETFNVPGFLNHEDNCECFYCTCLEYHQFVLKKTYLHALLYEHEGNVEVAKEFFCGCIKIYEYFKSKEDVFQKKISKKVSLDLVPTPQNMFIETYCLILFEYGNFSLRSGRVKNADKINKKLLQILESFSQQHIYLYNEVLAQRLNILSEKVPQKTRRNSISEDLNVAILEKTPESKHSRVVITPESTAEYLQPPKLKPKSLKFDLSDDEEENSVKAPTLPKNLPPFVNPTKTPAPSTSKIKIYTHKSTKKKKVLADIPPPKKDANARVSEFLVPMSPEAYTPDASKVDSHLVNRTKLLTSRLKNSNRKGEHLPSIVVTDENAGGRSRVRQNLLRQLDGGEEGERNGAPRRSARNRK